jgi:hypothetical protein
MTALPDTFMPEGPLRHQRQVPLYHMEVAQTGTLRRTAVSCAGAALLIAAIGLWLVPVIEGDAMMQLFKLAFSAALAVIGFMLLSRRRAAAGPEVHINPATREMTIIERDAQGRESGEIRHDIDALGDIVLRDGLLTARCAEGQPLLTLPVTDPRIGAALRGVLIGRAA